jgi:cytochrome c biogenesis protein ResB
MSRPLNSVDSERRPGWVRQLASARWTVLFFLLTAVAALAVAYQLMAPTVMMAVPFVLLLVNTGAAILTHARFRADLPLLLFHLALVALVALIALARLTYMEGTATLSSGTAFEGQLLTEAHGPLHTGRLADVHFTNEGFTENYSARGKLHATYNRVRWQDDAGLSHLAQIGDDHPLLIKGYKIYSTSHRGFSPLFLWQPSSGAEEYGTVQLADQQGGTFAPAMGYKLPNGTNAWVMLDFKTSEAMPGDARVDMGSKELAHKLVLRVGDARHVLHPGDKIDLPGGTLSYVRLDSWMGYAFSYDPTMPWLIATILIGIGSLIWFYARRLRWRASEDDS